MSSESSLLSAHGTRQHSCTKVNMYILCYTRTQSGRTGTLVYLSQLNNLKVEIDLQPFFFRGGMLTVFSEE